MKFIRPTRITDAMLTSSTVAEADFPAWNAATAYVVGDKVIRTQTHRIYERQVSGTTATAPESDLDNWVDIGPTNRWAMFDEKVGTVTTGAESITVVLEPGRINSMALLNVDASTVTVTLVANSETVYSASLDLVDNSAVGNWYDYFYEPIYAQDSLTITDLLDAALLDIPAYGEGELTVTLTKPGGTVSVGVLVVGLVTHIGYTLHGASVSIRDFSRKEVDQFGNISVTPRGYSKLMSASVVIDKPRTDAVNKELSRYTSTPVVWIGAEDYGSLVVYGFASEWNTELSNPSVSQIRLDVEGLV